MHLQQNKDSELSLRLKKGLYGQEQVPCLWKEALGRCGESLELYSYYDASWGCQHDGWSLSGFPS